MWSSRGIRDIAGLDDSPEVLFGKLRAFGVSFADEVASVLSVESRTRFTT